MRFLIVLRRGGIASILPGGHRGGNVHIDRRALSGARSLSPGPDVEPSGGVPRDLPEPPDAPVLEGSLQGDVVAAWVGEGGVHLVRLGVVSADEREDADRGYAAPRHPPLLERERKVDAIALPV